MTKRAEKIADFGDGRAMMFDKRWGVPIGACVDGNNVRVVGAVRGNIRNTRVVLLPLRVVVRLQDSQAGKDRSESVARRAMLAALQHPRLMGATVES